jgi:hypothetical protein
MKIQVTILPVATLCTDVVGGTIIRVKRMGLRNGHKYRTGSTSGHRYKIGSTKGGRIPFEQMAGEDSALIRDTKGLKGRSVSEKALRRTM